MWQPGNCLLAIQENNNTFLPSQLPQQPVKSSSFKRTLNAELGYKHTFNRKHLSVINNNQININNKSKEIEYLTHRPLHQEF